MESIETIKAKAAMIEEKVANPKKELSEAKTSTTKVERVSRIKEMHRWSFEEYHPFDNKARRSG